MITVLGSNGFIGSHIVKRLMQAKLEFYAPERNANLLKKKLGNIIYCIGLTADFRTKPFQTTEAHICKLNKLLEEADFDSLTYLSSTRVYIRSQSPLVKEEDKILIDPLEPDDLYNLTKLTGERLCLSSNRNTRIARVSNVTGDFKTVSNSFLKSIIGQIRQTKELHLSQTLNSAKDYILADDVAELLIKLSEYGKNEIYNIASGINTSNHQLVACLKKYFDFEVSVSRHADTVVFPEISNKKICDAFNYEPQNAERQLEKIFNSMNL